VKLCCLFLAAGCQLPRTAGYTENCALETNAYVTEGLNSSIRDIETLTGFADPRINSNDKVHNPNVTVLEWLGLSWDVISSIVNSQRVGFVANSGSEPLGAPR
jgi:hypothetical protein